MKIIILFCLTVVKSDETLKTQDLLSSDNLKEVINKDVKNSNSDSNRYITLAYLNVSWLDGDEQKFKEDDHERSKYGMGQVMDVSGQLVHITSVDDINDHSACNASNRDSFGNPISKYSQVPWIARIKRGGCDFEKKILHVLHLNAAGVIIYNNETGSELNYMKIKNEEVLQSNISSVFIPQYKGLELTEILEKYGEHQPVFISIRQGMRFLIKN